MTQKTRENKAFSPDQELGTNVKLWYAFMSIGAVLVQVLLGLSPRQRTKGNKKCKRKIGQEFERLLGRG